MLKDLEFEAESISLLLSMANFSFSLNLEFLIFSDLKCSIIHKRLEKTVKIFLPRRLRTCGHGKISDGVYDGLRGHSQELVAGELGALLQPDTVAVPVVALGHDAPVGPRVREEDTLEAHLVVRLVAVPEPRVVASQEVDVLCQIHDVGHCGREVNCIVSQFKSRK